MSIEKFSMQYDISIDKLELTSFVNLKILI